MIITIRNQAGETVQLANAPLARGGEAEVYAVPQFPRAVVKLYYPAILNKRGHAMHQKIDAIITGTPNLATIKSHHRLAWPLFTVFNERGKWRGYAMQKASGVPMTKLAHAMAYKEHFPHLDRKALVGYVLDLLGTVQTLHTSDIRIGDYNPANFLCDPQSSTVMLIDCDSWQVSAMGQTFPCPVAAPDMLPPELLGKKLHHINRTLESEYFALAILVFKLLMLGRHPFDVVGGESPVENIQRGYFPYGTGGGGIPKGPWYNIWSHLPFKIKGAFVRTFKDSSQNPDNRVSVEEWREIFQLYQREMERGWHDICVKPVESKLKEYRGHQSISQSILT